MILRRDDSQDREKLGRWGVRSPLEHHGRQLAILRRGLALLAPGGRLVYSTCSMDPLENEAVVAAALLEEPGARLGRIEFLRLNV